MNQLDFLDPSPASTRDQVCPLLIPSVLIDTTPPWVSYVASYPLHSISTEEQPLCSCLPSQDSVPTVYQVIHPIQTVEPTLDSLNLFESLDMCLISDNLLPLDEVLLDSLIQSNLLMDVGSVVTKYNPNFLNKTDIPMDWSSCVGISESSDSPFE